LTAEAELFRAFTAHTTLTGGGREHALRGYLAELLPRRYEVLTGGFALLDTANSLRPSTRQQDLLVVDTWKYPTLYRKGTMAIVMPESARVVIESKSKLNGVNDVRKALHQSVAGRIELGVHAVPTVLFGFEATATAESLRRFIEGSLDREGTDHSDALLPDVIGTLSGIIVRKEQHDGGLRYVFSQSAEDQADAIVSLIAYVLEQMVTDVDPPTGAGGGPNAAVDAIAKGNTWTHAVKRLSDMLGSVPKASSAAPLDLPPLFKFTVGDSTTPRAALAAEEEG
jgi:hypothetical protein